MYFPIEFISIFKALFYEFLTEIVKITCNFYFVCPLDSVIVTFLQKVCQINDLCSSLITYLLILNCFHEIFFYIVRVFSFYTYYYWNFTLVTSEKITWNQLISYHYSFEPTSSCFNYYVLMYIDFTLSL